MLVPFRSAKKRMTLYVSCVVIGAALCMSASRTGRADDKQSDFEARLIQEINAIRADPRSYIPRLQKFRESFHGNTIILEGNIRIRTREGTRVIDETIAYLKKVKPVHPLQFSECLALSAGDHHNDQKMTGGKGHRGSDGSLPGKRITKRCGKKSKTGESIAYGMYAADPPTPESVIMQLVVDDGVKDRVHRFKLFDAGFNFVGAVCGDHPDPKLGFMCVINTSGD